MSVVAGGDSCVMPHSIVIPPNTAVILSDSEGSWFSSYPSGKFFCHPDKFYRIEFERMLYMRPEVRNPWMGGVMAVKDLGFHPIACLVLTLQQSGFKR